MLPYTHTRTSFLHSFRFEYKNRKQMRSKRQVLTGKRTWNKGGTHIVQCDTKCNYQKEGDYEVLQKGCRT